MFATDRKWSKPTTYYTKIKRRRPGDQLMMIQQSYERSRKELDLTNHTSTQRQWTNTQFTPQKYSPDRASRYEETKSKESTIGLLIKYAGMEGKVD